MKTLPMQFRDDGFDFQQLKREGRVALYVKTKPGMRLQGYEVVLVQHIKEREILGRLVEEHEAMPTPSMWGTKGWSFSDQARAASKFSELCRLQPAESPITS